MALQALVPWSARPSPIARSAGHGLRAEIGSGQWMPATCGCSTSFCGLGEPATGKHPEPRRSAAIERRSSLRSALEQPAMANQLELEPPVASAGSAADRQQRIPSVAAGG